MACSMILIAGIVVSAVLLIWAVLAIMCVKLMFFTQKQSYQDSIDILAQKDTLFDELALERVEVIGVKEDHLTGYYASLFPATRKAVVLVHGIRANHIIGLQYASLFISRGYNILAIDQRAHGLSGGKRCTYGQQEKHDLLAWITLLRERLGKDCEIGLFGHSMGAATVLCYPELDRNIHFIVADCPYDRFKTFMLHQMRPLGFAAKPVYALARLITRLFFHFDPNSINPVEAISNQGKDIPVLFFHSMGDKAIPYQCAQRMYKTRNNPRDRLYIHKTAAHPDVYADDKEQYQIVLDEFMTGFK